MKRTEGSWRGVVALAVLIAVGGAGLSGCAQSYKADTYASEGVLRANKVDRGVVIGFRQVKIRANGTVGAVTGGAMGGVLGSQSDAFGINSALGTVGGTTLGGILGTTIEHVTGDTSGWEYIVRKNDGELLSVTQQDDAAVPVGQTVLIITGAQARLVPDYSVTIDPAPAKPTPLVTVTPPFADPVGAPPSPVAAPPVAAPPVAGSPAVNQSSPPPPELEPGASVAPASRETTPPTQ